MKIGDLVKLKEWSDLGPRIGIIYEYTQAGWRGKDELNEYKCLWDDPQWNHSFYFERELVVVDESR